MFGATSSLLTLFSSGKDQIDPRLLSVENFGEVRHASECLSILKHGMDIVKDDSYLQAALEMVIRLVGDRATAVAIQQNDQGLCSAVDNILGQKMHVPILCQLCLEAMFLLTNQRDGSSAKRRSSSGGGANTDVVATSTDKTWTSIFGENIFGRKKLTSSATIFRILKACHSQVAAPNCLLAGLKLILAIIQETEDVSKLVSCGVCDFLILSLHEHPLEEAVVVETCKCIDAILLFDLDECNSSLGCQDKLGEGFLCELIVGKVLPEKLDPSMSSVTWGLRVIGTLARRNPTNKEKLNNCGACEAISPLCTDYFLDDVDFAASVCWAFANLSFPSEENQTRLGSANACSIIIAILKKHIDNVIIIQEGCRAIHQLGELHDGNLQILVDLGTPKFCMELIRKYAFRDDILQWIVYALATLAESVTALTVLQDNNICVELVALMNRFVANDDLVQWAAMTISNISAEPSFVQELHQHHCCQVLIQALVHHLGNEDVCEEVLHTIGALSEVHAESRKTLIENSIGDFVLKAMEQHPESEAVAEQSLYALVNVLHLSVSVLTELSGWEASNTAWSPLSSSEQHLLKSITYAFLLNGGFKLLARLTTKFLDNNSTIAMLGSQLFCCLAIGCNMLDGRGENIDDSKNKKKTSLDKDSYTAKLGGAGAASTLSSILARYLREQRDLVPWCLFSLILLCNSDYNIGLLRSANVVGLMKQLLEAYAGNDDVIVSLIFDLIFRLDADAGCRNLLGAALYSDKDSRHMLVQVAALHLSSPSTVSASCRAISSLCFSPTEDAFATLFASSNDKDKKMFADFEVEESQRPSRSSIGGAGSPLTSTDWVTFGENVDHLNVVIPPENDGIPTASLDSDGSQSQQSNSKAPLLRRLSFALNWTSKSDDSTGKTVVPISANYEQSQQQSLGNGKNVLMDAASSLISTGLSDQEERAIKAMRQKGNQIKNNNERLVESGCLGLLQKILVDFAQNYEIVVLAVNALNNLALDSSIRFRLRDQGLLANLVAILHDIVERYSVDEMRDLSKLGIREFEERDWVRLIVIITTITLGTSCLPDSSRVETSSNQWLALNAAVELNQEILGSLGVLDQLSKILDKAMKGDVVLCEVTLRAFHLIVLGNSANQGRLGDIMTESGQNVLGSIAQVLQENLEVPRIAYYACIAIGAIGADSTSNSSKFDEYDVCKLVLRVLKRYIDSEEVVEACCQAICGLKSLTDHLGQSGICEHIIHALTIHVASTSVAEWVCRAIGSLAESQYNKIEMEKHHISKIVTSTLQRHVSNDGILSVFSRDQSSAGVVQWGCTAIYYLATGYEAEGFQQRLVAAGACDAVARALMKYAEVEATAYCCCRALVVLVDNNEALASNPTLSGVCQYIVEALHLFPSSVLVAKWGCRAAAVLAESHELNISKLGAAGACESIPLIIQSHPASEQVAVAGCKVIAFMSEQTSNGFAVRFGHAGACEAVISALKKHINSPILTARACIAISTLAMVPGNARWFGPAGGCDVLQAALLIHMSEATVVKFIVSAIGQLCSIDHNKERFGMLNACELIVETAEIHVNDLDTAQSCCDAIGKLCESLAKSSSPSTTTPTSQTPSGRIISREVLARNPHYLAGRRNRAVLYESGACRVVVQALDNHLADENAARYMCQTISILSQGETSSLERQQMGELGACKAVTKALQFHEGREEVAVCGCLAVQALTLNNEQNQATFGSSNVCPVVVLILRGFRHSPHTSVMENAARAITNLSMVFPPNKHALGQAGACEGLLEALELHVRNQEIVKSLIQALFHVCDGNGFNQTKIAFSGAPDILNTVLNRYLDEERIVDFTLSIMIGMGRDKAGQAKLGQVLQPKLLQTLVNRYEKSDHILAFILATLGVLCAHSKMNQDKFGQSNMGKLVLSVLSKHLAIPGTSKSLLGGSMIRGRSPSVFPEKSQLTLDGSEESNSEGGGGASSLLLPNGDADACLVDYIGEVSIVKEGCRTIYFLCQGNEGNRQRLLALGALDVLTSLASSSILRETGEGGDDEKKFWAKNAMELLLVPSSSSS